MEPREFAQLVNDVKNAKKTLGTANYNLSEGEQRSKLFRKSIFVAQDIKEGQTLTEENIRVVRPSNGLHPRYYNSLLGKKITKNISKGTPFDWSMIEEKE